jgi:hypothetical protein
MTILLLCLALLTCGAALAEKPVDLDLSALSGTVVYSQVYDMMMEPERYMGMQVRMKGSFSYFQDPETKKEYFAVVIADATACCARASNSSGTATITRRTIRPWTLS